MGRYSDSEDERRSRKKRRSRSRSRSRSSNDSHSSKSKHKKSKKSKHKRRSRSPTTFYKRKASRSRSTSRTRSKYRSRSRSYSPKPRSRKHSRSRSRSDSRSRSRRSSRSRSKTRHHRSRSSSRSRRRSRSRSSSRSKSRRAMKLDKAKMEELEREAAKADPCANIPGFYSKSTSEQAEIRLQMALQAAASADEKLKDQGAIPKSIKSNSSFSSLQSLDDSSKKARAIEDIEKSGFEPAAFSSSKDKPSSLSINDAHDNAIFGGAEPVLLNAPTSKELKKKDTEAIMHTNLYVSAAEKMEHWKDKLRKMRQRKLEKDSMY